jgi:hypothetical protein
MAARFCRFAVLAATCWFAAFASLATASPPERDLVPASHPIADLVVAPPPVVHIGLGCETGEAQEPGQPALRLENLIQLIVNTVQSDSWQQNGGTATIEYCPKTLALFINQTPDAHEEIDQLLSALCRLYDIEVALEVRVLAISEAFLQQCNDDKCATKAAIAPIATVQRTAQNHSLAFLNDDLVRRLMTAGQSDRRTGILQMPKFTLFDGQVAKVSMIDDYFFDSCADATRRTRAAMDGVRLSVEPVVSADRRFIRLKLQADQRIGTSAADSSVAPEAVVVPDGGTVVLGGWQRMTKVNSEFGPPCICKIPYMDRIFGGPHYSVDAQRVFVLVTARVIVNAEEEPRSQPPTVRCSPPKAAHLIACPEVPLPCHAKDTPASNHRAKVVATLLEAYNAACADNCLEDADRFARAALAIDPTCFSNKR